MKITDQIEEKYSSMSKTQKKIATFVSQNVTEVSYMNIKSFAQKTGTSEASIIRFCSFMGFKGFPEFKKALQAQASDQISMKDRLRASYDAYGEKENGVVKVFQDDIKRIDNTLLSLNMDDFFLTCEKIILARRVYIIACRSAASLGQFFQYYLNMVLGNVTLISDTGCNADDLSVIYSEDLVIGITFQRYSKTTIHLFDYAAGRGAEMVAITDSPVSPIAKKGSHVFVADTKMPTYLDSFTAPLTLITAFLTQIGKMKNVELEHRITGLESFHRQFDIFEE